MLVTLIGGRNIHFYNIWVYVVVQKGWYLSVIIKKYSIICVIWLRHFLLFDFWPTMLQDFGTNSVNNYKAHFPFWHHQWLTQVNIVWDDFGYNLEKMTLLYSSPAYMSGLLDPTWGRDGPCILYIYIYFMHTSWTLHGARRLCWMFLIFVCIVPCPELCLEDGRSYLFTYILGLMDPTWGRNGACIFAYIFYAHLPDTSWVKNMV